MTGASILGANSLQDAFAGGLKSGLFGNSGLSAPGQDRTPPATPSTSKWASAEPPRKELPTNFDDITGNDLDVPAFFRNRK